VKNREDSPLLMRADILLDLTNVSEISSQRIQFIFNSIFYAGWHQMIVMDTTYLQTVEIYYCGGYVPHNKGIYSFRAHRCERKIGPDNSIYIITLFLCRLLSDVCYEDYMTVDEDYCGEYVSLFATISC
jgi:hypothetical protein